MLHTMQICVFHAGKTSVGANFGLTFSPVSASDSFFADTTTRNNTATNEHSYTRRSLPLSQFVEQRRYSATDFQFLSKTDLSFMFASGARSRTSHLFSCKERFETPDSLAISAVVRTGAASAFVPARRGNLLIIPVESGRLENAPSYFATTWFSQRVFSGATHWHRAGVYGKIMAW